MKAKNHWSYNDHQFEDLFERYQLKPGLFTHEAHIRLAYIHINKYGLAQAEKNMCDQIQGFAKSLGGGDKYNETVTVAAVKTVDHFMKKSKSSSVKDFINEFPRLITQFKGLLEQHYGFNVFSDPKAKKEYIEPDLQPF